MKRQYYINSSAFKEYETSVKGIQIFINVNILNAVIFHGRQANPTTYFVNYDSLERLIIRIDKEIKLQYDENIAKILKQEKKKNIAKEEIQKINIGDIFATSWGYDETHVDFFQVIDKPTKAKVTIRKINHVRSDNTFCSAYIQPVPNDFIGEPKNCSVNYNGAIVKADEYGHAAYLTTADQTHYTSWGR